jgi:SAM-dependent methyltransferase
MPPLIEILPEGSHKRVRVLGPQARSHFNVPEFTTAWPDDLLYALADFKKGYFCDSYQRFEHPNYIQKHVDITLDYYGLSLKDKRVLDFGCGFGVSAHLMMKRGANCIVGTDLDEANIRFGRRFFDTFNLSQNVELRLGEPVLRLESEAFDVVWLQAVVEHLLPQERADYFQEFWRTLRPGGVLVVTETPNRFWPKETHTTDGRWLLTWRRPAKVFARMRREYEFRSYSDTDFYRSGIIGSSYRELLECLSRPPDCEQLALKRRGYARFYYSYAQRKSLAKSFVVSLATLFEPVAQKVLRRPLTAFAPYLNHLAFRKAWPEGAGAAAEVRESVGVGRVNG